MKGIIFDLDGTLWDSAENVAISWDLVIQEKKPKLRRVTTEDVMGIMGLTMTDIAKKLFPMLTMEEAEELLEECCKEENRYLREQGGRLYPYLEETLVELAKEYPLFIVSNCQTGYIEAFLDHYQFWDYFKDIACFGTAKKQKFENILGIMKKNYITEAIYIGDILGDYESSKKAGTLFIHASYGFGTINTVVPFITSLKELPEEITKTFNK